MTLSTKIRQRLQRLGTADAWQGREERQKAPVLQLFMCCSREEVFGRSWDYVSLCLHCMHAEGLMAMQGGATGRPLMAGTHRPGDCRTQLRERTCPVRLQSPVPFCQPTVPSCMGPFFLAIIVHHQDLGLYQYMEG